MRLWEGWELNDNCSVNLHSDRKRGKVYIHPKKLSCVLYVYLSEREREFSYERVFVCVCVYARERESESESERVRE